MSWWAKLFCCCILMLAVPGLVKCDPAGKYRWNGMLNCVQKVRWDPRYNVTRRSGSNEVKVNDKMVARRAEDFEHTNDYDASMFKGSVELTRVTEWPGIVIGELKIGDATGLEVIVNISIATAYNNTAVKMYLVSDQITDTMNEDLPIQLIVVKLLPGRTETATLCFQTHYKHSNPWQDWTDHTSRKYVLYEKTQVLRQQYTDEVGNLNFELTLYESAKDNYYPPGSAGIRYPERFSKQW